MVKGNERKAVVIDGAAQGVERAILILSEDFPQMPLRSEDDLIRLAEGLAAEYSPSGQEKPRRRVTAEDLVWLLLGAAAVGAAWAATVLL